MLGDRDVGIVFGLIGGLEKRERERERERE